MPPESRPASSLTRRLGVGAASGVALAVGLALGAAVLALSWLGHQSDFLDLLAPILWLLAWLFAGALAARVAPDLWWVGVTGVLLPCLLAIVATWTSFADSPLGPVPALCVLTHVVALAGGGALLVRSRWRARQNTGDALRTWSRRRREPGSPAA